MLTRPRPIAVGLALAVVLAVAACGGSGTATQKPTAAPTAAAGGGGGGAQASSAAGGGGGAIDAGTILTSDLAGSIIGGTLTKIPIPAIAGMSLAGYTNTTGDSVTALVQPVPAGAGTAIMQAAILSAGAKGEIQPLTGIGDAAGKVVDTNDATIVFVKGGTLVVVHAEAEATSGTDLEAKLETVAKQIAGSL